MADLGINTGLLEKKTKPLLKQTLTSIKNANSIIKKLKVPSDYVYEVFLTISAPNMIEEIMETINYLTNKIDSVIQQVERIEGKNHYGINSSAYFASVLLDPNMDWEIPDFLDNEMVKVYDTQIKDLENQIEDIDKKISDLTLKIANDKKAMKRSNGLYKGNPKLEEWQNELKKLKNQKIELSNKITQIKQFKDITINTLKSSFYSNLTNNNDFEIFISASITEKEAVELTRIMSMFSGTAWSGMLERDDFCTNYDLIKKTIQDNNLDYGNINWELVKSAYDKGFNFFEISMVNTELQSKQLTYTNLLGEADKTVSYYAYRLNYMTEEERSIANYLYNSKGKEAFEDYLKLIENDLNSREGMINASKFLSKIDLNDPNLGDYIQTHFKGLSDGTDNFWVGLENALGGMDGVMSPEQYETMYIIQILNENDKKALVATYEISSSIGNMLPAIVISTITSIALTPAAGQLVGSTLMGVSAGGNAAESAYQEGNGYWESIFYGFLNGSSEAALGYFLGGIPGLSKLDDIPGLKGLCFNALKEGGEESLQAIIDPYLKNLALGTNETIDWNEVLKSGFYGLITAGIMNGGNMVINGATVTVDSVLKHSDLITKAAESGVVIDASKIGQESYWNELSLQLTGKGLPNYINAEVQTEVNVDKKTEQKKQSKVRQAINKVNTTVSNKVSTVVNTAYTKGASAIINTAANITNKVSSNINVKNDINTTTESKLPDLKIEDLSYSQNSAIKGAAAYLASNVRKYSYTNTNEVIGLNEQIMNEGLYHFTTAADAILSSGYIKSSDMISSYGNKKTFFFAGIPEVGAFATNIDSIPLKTEAVKVMPNEEIVNSSKLKVRAKDDGAISYDGNFSLEGTIATKEYFCLFKEGDKLVYKSVSKEFYDNYQNTPEGQQLSNFVKKKSNITAIKNDFLCNMISKNTGAEISNNVTTKVDVSKNNIVTSQNFNKNQLNAIKKYDNFDDFNDAYIHGKTGLNTQEWYEVMGYYKVNQSMNISQSIATELENIFYEDGYVIGIHKTGVDGDLISKNGLHLTGHKFANSSDIDLKLNIEFTNGYSDFLMQIAAATTYKTSDGGNAIIVKIPKSEFNNVESLVDFDGTLPILKPEYIAGYVEVSKGIDGKIQFDNIIVNSFNNIQTMIKNAADYKNNGYTGIGISGYGIAASTIDQVVLNGLTKSESAVFGYICKGFEGRIDFTNPADVLEKREVRLTYIKRDAELYVQLKNMERHGASLDEMARFANKNRNAVKDVTRKEGKFLDRCTLGCRNIAMYGNLDLLDNGKYKSDLIEKIDYKGRTTYEIKPEIIDGWLQECGINDTTAQNEELYNKFLQKVGSHFGLEEKVSELALGPDLEWVKQQCVQEFEREGVANPSDEEIYNKIINKALSPNPSLNVALGISQDLSFSWP